MVADLEGTALLARGQDLVPSPNTFTASVPLSDYHEFYLFWWFTWSLMIGQFIARFWLGSARLRSSRCCRFPLSSLALWFAVLYQFHLEAAAPLPSVTPC